MECCAMLGVYHVACIVAHLPAENGLFPVVLLVLVILLCD